MLRHMVVFVALVPFPRVGYSHPRGQKPDQPDVDHQPSQEDHCSGGPQTSMGLRKCPNKHTAVIFHILLHYYKPIKDSDEQVVE